MKLELTALRTKVAKRLFAVLLVTIFIPLTVAGAISYNKMKRLIINEIQDSQVKESSEFGLLMHGRLKRAQDYLALYLEQTQRSQVPNSALNAFLAEYFVDVTIVARNELENEAPAIASQLALNQQQKLFVSNTTTWPSLSIVSTTSSLSRELVAIGRLKSAYVWDPVNLDGAQHFYVFDENRSLVHASSPLSQNAIETILTAPESTQVFSTTDTERDLMLAKWSLFMDYQFGVPEWTVVTSKPLSELEQRLTKFTYTYTAAALLTLLLVVLAALQIVRRSLSPINRLMRGTQEVAQNNFNHQVVIKSDDEYEALATHFNLMSSNLKGAFEFNQAVSSVDAAVLKSEKLEGFLQAVHAALPDICAADITVLCLNGEHIHNDCLVSYYDHTTDQTHLEYLKRDSLLSPLNSEILPGRPAQLSYPKALLDSLQLTVSEDLDYSAYYFGNRFKVNAVLIAGHQLTPDHTRTTDFLGHVRVVLEALQRDRALKYQANFDELTGVRNRKSFSAIVNEALIFPTMERAHLLFIDLDRFKGVNDTLGHHIGDKLLREVAARLTAIVPPTATFSRFGGDEFTIFVTDMSGSNAQAFANEVIAFISSPYMIDNYRASVGASIGISSYPEDGDDYDALLRKADLAMYYSKEHGREQATVYSDSLDAELKYRTELEAILHDATARDEFDIVLQPKLDLHTQSLSGFEALSRFYHPKKGPLSPYEVFRVAEETGVILELGHRMMVRTFEQIKHWSDQGPFPYRVAINVSPVQLLDPGFVARTAEALKTANILASQVELEITEGVFMDSSDKVIETLKQLRALGISVAVDDFGTGFSSLSYITALPVDRLKIDRSFISRIKQGDKHKGVIRSIIQLAHNLGLSVTAEGVETEVEQRFLEQAACDEIQGYLYSKPLSLDRVTTLLQAEQRLLTTDTE
ncbi:EAL domain-containing protein [Neptunomonas sp. XY-337]|uniref:bifunctional diguanylate cyclase/phosphodiesterase n=1 Tax=Neptunomonas sp. XY-337 TaxID=2561897 RepID=UPI0010AB1E0A|nr:EAL domain-containing protein [Neptunomonas sp. XY-337]